MAALRQSFSYRDHIGRIATVRFYVADLTAGSNLQIAVEALTNAVFVVARGPFSTVIQPLAYPGTNLYQSVLDKARMSMLDEDGMIHEFLIPAPHEGIFDFDSITVKPMAATVAAFQAAMVANALTGSGRAFSQLIAGRRTMGEEPRRGIAAPNPTP